MVKILSLCALAGVLVISWARPHSPRRITGVPTTVQQQQQQSFETTGELYINDVSMQTTDDQLQTSAQQLVQNGNDSLVQNTDSNFDLQTTDSNLAKGTETTTAIQVPSRPKDFSQDLQQRSDNSPKTSSIQSHSPRHIVPDQPQINVQGQLSILPENPTLQGQQNIGLQSQQSNPPFFPNNLNSPVLQKAPELIVPVQTGGHWDQQQGSFVRAPLTAEDLEKLAHQQQTLVQQGSAQRPLPETPKPDLSEGFPASPPQQALPPARNNISNVPDVQQQHQISDLNQQLPIGQQTVPQNQQINVIPASTQPKEIQLLN